MEAVAEVADGTHRKNDLQPGIAGKEVGEQGNVPAGYLVHREAAAPEVAFGQLVAVAHNAARGVILVDHRRAKGQEEEIQAGQQGGGGMKAAVDEA